MNLHLQVHQVLDQVVALLQVPVLDRVVVHQVRDRVVVPHPLVQVLEVPVQVPNQIQVQVQAQVHLPTLVVL